MSELELEHICLRKALADLIHWWDCKPGHWPDQPEWASARRVLNYIKTREEHHGTRPSDIVEEIVAA